MNPSYENGGLGTLGVKPGVITRLPDSPAPDSPAPMKLGGGGKGPNKKLAIFAIAIVVILMIVMVVIILMGQNRGGGGSSTENTSTTYEEELGEEIPASEYTGKDGDFYQYANYVLYGSKDVRVDLGNYNADRTYAIATAMEEKNTKYFQAAFDLWRIFYNRISKDTALFVEGSKLRELVTAQNSLMDFFSKFANAKDWTEEEMWVAYNTNGLDNAIKAVRADYDKIEKTTYEAGANWAKLKADWNETALKLYDAYKNKGCIGSNGNDDFNQECIDNNVDDFKTFMEQFSAADSQLEGSGITINGLMETLIKNCFEMKKDLNEAEK